MAKNVVLSILHSCCIGSNKYAVEKCIQGVTGGTDQTSGGVPYVKLYRYNPKHLYPKLNGYGDNGQRKVWTSYISAFCTQTAVSRTTPPISRMTACGAYVGQFYGAQAPPNAIRQYFIAARYANAWNPKTTTGIIARVFVVQFNGFMSLTSQFGVKYRY